MFKKLFFICVGLCIITPLTALAAMVYVPKNLKTHSARVVVVIHGCLQSAEAMAAGTGWNSLAEKNNLVVVYPQVPENTNPLNCWNWYLKENQSATSGQLKDIMAEIRFHIKALKLEKPQIFVTGISSGAATAAGLLACFPNDFKAGAIHSGPPYGLVSDLKQGNKLLSNGPTKEQKILGPCHPQNFQGSVMVIQGREDKVVHPKNAKALISQFVGGKKIKETIQIKKEGYQYTLKSYYKGDQLKGQLIEISQLGHAWGGFEKTLRNAFFVGRNTKSPTILPFFDHKGPSSTQLIWNFFKTSH